MTNGNNQETIQTPQEELNPKFKQAQELTERMEKASQELKRQADRLEALKAEALLSGTAGIKPVDQEPKRETPRDYRLRIQREIREGKFNISNDKK